ncbi:MAG: hypothetical protein ABL898_01820 [Hyphomicrobiaceae bacterium]|nr:hypothetical protein [Hyphomicrobiaceae bacterium]
MDIMEARWVRAALEKRKPKDLSPLLNIGSSTLEFRSKRQPWITEEIVAPLERRGIDLIHVDIKQETGVDIVADLMADVDLERLKQLHPRAIMCSNLLEHVTDAKSFARRCSDLVPSGGTIIVTGPHSYPYHRDPIDTMFRPTPTEAAALFPDCVLEDSAIIDSGKSYLDNIRARPWIVFRHIGRAPFPMFGYTAWKRSMAKLHWLTHNYLYFCIVLRKK